MHLKSVHFYFISFYFKVCDKRMPRLRHSLVHSTAAAAGGRKWRQNDVMTPATTGPL